MALTVHEKLLLAAAELDASGKQRFTAEDLVVAAWRAFPDTFGLAGYLDGQGKPQFPNSNRVFAEIMGSKPIRKQGLLVKTGTKVFELTEAGRRRIAVLQHSTQPVGPKKAAYSREIQRELRKVMKSRAVAKHQDGRDDSITFNDASGFWGISPRSSAMELQGKLGNLKAILETAAHAAKAGPIVLQHGEAGYTEQDMAELLSLSAELEDRFVAELDVIRKRTDERGRGR